MITKAQVRVAMSRKIDTGRVMNVAAVSERLGVSFQHVYRLVSDNRIAHFRVGKAIRFPAAAIEKISELPEEERKAALGIEPRSGSIAKASQVQDGGNEFVLQKFINVVERLADLESRIASIELELSEKERLAEELDRVKSHGG